MNIRKIRDIHNKFRNEFNLIEADKLTYTTIKIDRLDTAPIWTGEYFDKKYDLFSDKFNKFICLKEVAEIEKGFEPGSKNYIEYFDREDSDVSFIKTSELANWEINFTSKQYISNENYQKNKQDIKIKDIFFTKDGKVGDVAITTNNNGFLYGSGLVKIRLKNNNLFTPEFIFLLLTLKEFGGFFAKKYTVRGTTIPHLNIDYINNMEIPCFEKEVIDKYTKLILEIIDYETE